MEKQKPGQTPESRPPEKKKPLPDNAITRLYAKIPLKLSHLNAIIAVLLALLLFFICYGILKGSNG